MEWIKIAAATIAALLLGIGDTYAQQHYKGVSALEVNYGTNIFGDADNYFNLSYSRYINRKSYWKIGANYFEKTDDYYNLQGQLRTWADEISTVIRKISISRNTDKTNKHLEKIIEEVSATEISLNDTDIVPEIIMNDKQEYDDIAHSELINQLDILINQKHACTKYKALNLQTGITIEEKKFLETVLDIIKDKYPDKADGLISTIIKEYKSKKLSKQ